MSDAEEKTDEQVEWEDEHMAGVMQYAKSVWIHQTSQMLRAMSRRKTVTIR